MQYFSAFREVFFFLLRYLSEALFGILDQLLEQRKVSTAKLKFSFTVLL